MVIFLFTINKSLYSMTNYKFEYYFLVITKSVDKESKKILLKI